MKSAEYYGRLFTVGVVGALGSVTLASCAEQTAVRPSIPHVAPAPSFACTNMEITKLPNNHQDLQTRGLRAVVDYESTGGAEPAQVDMNWGDGAVEFETVSPNSNHLTVTATSKQLRAGRFLASASVSFNVQDQLESTPLTSACERLVTISG